MLKPTHTKSYKFKETRSCGILAEKDKKSILTLMVSQIGLIKRQIFKMSDIRGYTVPRTRDNPSFITGNTDY
jgi:hypothetical protein